MLRSLFLPALPCLCFLSFGVGAAQITPSSVMPMTLGGIINQDSDDTPAFTPDRSTVFFDRSEGKRKTIMVSRRVKGRWSAPQPASFSGQWFDQDPVVAPDGSYLLFNSDRPVKAGAEPLLQSYFSGGPAPGSNIWRVDRQGQSWGEPVWIGATINSDVFIDFGSIAADGTLYFMRWDPNEKSMHLWRSPYKDGSYRAPEFVTLGDPKETIHDPAVAPDQSFIVFDSGRVKGGLGRLCIAFREGDHWGAPIDMGDRLNQDLPWGAHLDPDGSTVYFTGTSGIQKFSLKPWLAAMRRPKAVT
jgi:WD40-like Beta Propeller Repeat